MLLLFCCGFLVSVKVGFGSAVVILLRINEPTLICNGVHTTLVSGPVTSCCWMSGVLLGLLMWQASIVSSNLEMTAIKLSLLLLCLQAFPKPAILVCDRSVVMGTQRPIQMHAPHTFKLMLVYPAIGRLTLPCLCSCAVVLSSQLDQRAMRQPRLDSFWSFWIRKKHKA